MQCLDDNVIAALGAGRLDDGERANVLTHAAACIDCRALLVSVARALPRTATWAPSDDDDAAVPAVGLTVAGRYVLERRIGSGGAGVVWVATDTHTDARVALKFLRAADASQARRLAREARVLQKLDHPAIVRVRDLIESAAGEPVVVMELLDGESLGDWLAREPILPLAHLAGVMVPMLEAVAYAHDRGLVHRDLKPENVFLAREAGAADAVVKVLDFGLAKLSKDWVDSRSASLTETGAVVGTPRYMAPEQLFGEDDVDARADVWAAATLAYRALSGHFPFDGRNFGEIFRAVTRGSARPIDEVAPHLPADVRRVLMAALVVDRTRRTTGIVDLLDVLRAHVGAPTSVDGDVPT